MNTPGMDPLTTFKSLKDKFPEAFFFESERFSLIGLKADERIRQVGSQVVLIKDGRETKSTASFMDLVSVRLKELSYPKAAFPYQQGGVFGCLGYEMVAELEPKLKKAGYFRSLSNSNEVLAEVVVCRNVIVFQDGEVHFGLTDLSVSQKDLRAGGHPHTELSGVADFSGFERTQGRETFLKGVARIQKHIQAGDIFQAVLSERYETTTSVSASDLFSAIREHSPSAYSFYFDFFSSSFMGASPETMLKIQDNILETHPIAGTKPRGRNTQEDVALEVELKESIKEGAEHLMLVDLARNDLGRVSKPGTVKVEAFRKLLRLPNVMHLSSVVKAIKSDSKSDLEALCSAFPAGTLSGAPKIRAMEILSQVESRPRGFYGGCVVAFDFSGGLDSCISIRSLELKAGKAILRAGAGIVADSDPESEYQEVQHKLASLVKILHHYETKQIKKQVIA